MLGSQSHVSGQSDWEVVKHLFSSGIKLFSGLLPGKLAYLQFLWNAYKDAKNSAEALQEHHWKTALLEFIAGAVQILTLGRLSLEGWVDSAQATGDAIAQPAATPVIAQPWSQVRSTCLLYTSDAADE